MKYPKMIIFDYGDTLLCEPDWNTDRGNKELLKYVSKNPNNCTYEDIRNGAELIFGKHIESIREQGYDICGQIGNRVLYEYLGIEFSISPLQMETIFWNGASKGAVIPDADKIIDYINKKGIRSAVISNLLWSGDALRERLNRLLPNNQFEFVITSSDYLIRKPNRILFDIALQKANLKAEEVWYCGNNFCEDIMGASQTGIFPVLYDSCINDYSDKLNLDLEYLHIHEWKELIDALERLIE